MGSGARLVFSIILIALSLGARVEPSRALQTTRLRIAVLPFQQAFTNPTWAGNWDISLGITELVEEALFKTGRYSVIERRALDAVLREQGLGDTRNIDPASAVRVGRILGVQALITGSVNQFELRGGGLVNLPFGVVGLYTAQVQLAARAINTGTAELMAVVRSSGQSQGLLALARLEEMQFGVGEFTQTVLGRALDQAINDLVSQLIATLK